MVFDSSEEDFSAGSSPLEVAPLDFCCSTSRTLWEEAAECVETVHQSLIYVSSLVTVEANEAKEGNEVLPEQENSVQLSKVILQRQRTHLSRAGQAEPPLCACMPSAVWGSQAAGSTRQKSLDGEHLPGCCPHSMREHCLF